MGSSGSKGLFSPRMRGLKDVGVIALAAFHVFPAHAGVEVAIEISLICFVIAWSYDFVLMLRSPQPMVKSL